MSSNGRGVIGRLEEVTKVLKPLLKDLVTWAFFKVNNNLHVDLGQNQVMRCISLCRSETTSLKIMALHTICCKGFIAYHKVNGILAMKNTWSKIVLICLIGIWSKIMLIYLESTCKDKIGVDKKTQCIVGDEVVREIF
jgi:hypothetical protein